jgi:hypothetical protein
VCAPHGRTCFRKDMFALLRALRDLGSQSYAFLNIEIARRTSYDCLIILYLCTGTDRENMASAMRRPFCGLTVLRFQGENDINHAVPVNLSCFNVFHS